MTKNVVLTGRAWAAKDTLTRWAEALQDLDARDRNTPNRLATPVGRFTPANGVVVIFDERGRIAGERDYAAEIHNLASEVLREHLAYIRQGIQVVKNTDAVAAWRLVLRTRKFDELHDRLNIAITASARVVPGCKRIFSQN